MELTYDEIKTLSVEYVENMHRLANVINNLDKAYRDANDELEAIYNNLHDKLYENYKCVCPICGNIISNSLYNYMDNRVCPSCKGVEQYPVIVAYIKERYKRDDVEIVSFTIRGDLYWIGVRFSDDCEVYGLTLQVKDFETVCDSSGPCD
jgi:hypothetical protein